MSNSFDFELVADDKVSEAITRIDEAVRKLDPQLQKTRTGLQLGGQESADGLDSLSGRLDTMARAARDNVQYIGDMVPPLKMVGELATKYAGIAGRIGFAGVAAYALAKGAGAAAEQLKVAADNAYRLDVASKNAGMRVDEFSRLSGAMQILGIDSESASQSVEGLYKTFNDAMQGRNGNVLAILAQMGVQISKNKDGTADVMGTMESLARVFPSLSPEKQKTVADALGLDEAGLKLLREGARLKELLSKSDQFGLTVDPQLNDKLTEMNSTLNELGASWDGLKLRSKNKLFEGLLSDGSVQDGLKGIQDILTHGVDSISLSHALGATRGKEADQLREGYNDPEFYNSLDAGDKIALNFGVMTDSYRKRYAEWKRPQESARQLQNDLNVINRVPIPGATNVPYGQARNNAIGLRNHNPGNLRAAPNATGKSGGFSTFNSDADGQSAMARQLMLYGDRGNNTLEGIIHTYAPAKENKTQAYIDNVSQMTGFDPKARLDLHDPDVLQKVMSAMISHENGTQPYSPDELNASINRAVTDDRWSGLRDPSILDRQRRGMLADDQGDVTGQITEAMKVAMENSAMKLDLTLIDDRTGKRQKVPTQNGGRVTVPMSTP